MVRFLSIGIDVISTAVVLIPTMMILFDTCLKECGRRKKRQLMVFALYLSGLFSVTGIPAAGSLTIEAGLNFVPLLDGMQAPLSYLKNSLLNLLLFLPFGFLLPAVWRNRYGSLRKILAAGLAMSAFIEISQLFTYRLTDVDDLITNTAGTAAGYGLFLWYGKRTGKDEIIPPEEKNPFTNREPCFIIIMVFLIMFLVQPLIAGNLWQSVLSSTWWDRIS